MDAGTVILSAVTGLIGLGGALGNAYLNKKSEGKKQELLFEHSRLQMVFDERKASCRIIVDEMYKAVKMVSFKQPYDNAWEPIQEDKFEATREILIKESLFIDEKAGRAIQLFLDILKDAVDWDAERDIGLSFADKDRMIRRSHEELQYLSNYITNFLQYQICLIKNEPLIQKKIALLEACRFISNDRFKGLNFPNQDIIKLDGFQSPMDIVKLAENNLVLFKREYANFLNFLKTDPLKLRHESFLSEITQANKILANL